MDKQEAINMLGGTPKKAAEAMGYKAIQSIYIWPSTLSQGVADKVVGAVARLKAKKKAPKPTPVISE